MIRAALIGLVKGYRLLLSPWLGSACRFSPTCSAYSLQALERHGAAAGTYLTVARIARCHPWCAGGIDEVPAAAPRLFRRFAAGCQAGPDPASPGTWVAGRARDDRGLSQEKTS